MSEDRLFVSSRGNLIEMMIDDEIGSPSEYRNEFIALADATENDEIIININTVGGSMSTSVNFFHLMKQCRAPITTVAMGDVCSGGSMIFLGGDEMVVHPHISFMVHNASGGYAGKEPDVLAYSQHMSSMLQDFMTDVYQHFLTPAELQLMLDGKEYWMKSGEVIQRLQTRAELLQAEQEEESVEVDGTPEELQIDYASLSAKELKDFVKQITGITAKTRKEAEEILGL